MSTNRRVAPTTAGHRLAPSTNSENTAKGSDLPGNVDEFVSAAPAAGQLDTPLGGNRASAWFLGRLPVLIWWAVAAVE